MPPLLLSAQLKPDVVITSADSDDAIDESDDDRFVVIPQTVFLWCAHGHTLRTYVANFDWLVSH